MVIVLEQVNSALAGGIGLVSETIAARKKEEERARLARGADATPRTPHVQTDEEQWELDEVTNAVRRDSATNGDMRTVDSSGDDHNENVLGEQQKVIRNPSRQADEFLKRHQTPESTSNESGTPRKLLHPVVIPQRRPGDRVRGFVRAYAPDLLNCGIDQNTFIDFLVTFTRASRPPKWMSALNLAGNAGWALPAHAAGFGVGVAVAIVNAIAMELKGRSQSNEFLRKLNEGFFRPRGLYCLVMSFDNTHESAITEQSLLGNATEASTPKTGVGKYTSRIRSHDGLSGPVEFPDTAPLVFPELDWLIEHGDAEQTKKLGKNMKFRKFVADYYDRRAQTDYAFKNATSPLAAAPTRGFASKFGDPTDATNRSPISLATGGLVPYSKEAFLERTRGGRRKIKDKVLYMIIINMPSEDDLRRVEQVMEEAASVSATEAEDSWRDD